MGILDIVFPKTCLECGSVGRYICGNCLKKVSLGRWTDQNHFSIFKYEGVIRKAIISLKYKYSTEIAKELAEICARKLGAGHFSPSTILVPVPLHWYRKNYRGFNQSEEMGRLIAGKMGWKIAPDLLVKEKSTKPQAELKGSARRKNLRSVFAVNAVYSPNFDYQLTLFDDVYTTGSTLYEAKRVLLSAGAKKVWDLTIARD